MRWTERFARQVITMDEAVRLVRSGDRVMGGMPEPAPFLEVLAARDDLSDVEVFLTAPRTGGVAVAENPGITLFAGFLTDATRTSRAQVEVLPVHFSGTQGFIRRWNPRVRVVLIGEPTDDGVVYPGAAVANDDDLVNGARSDDSVVIGIVEANQPRLRGHTFRVEQFDALVELPDDAPPPFYDPRRVSAHVDAFVAAIDELIPDGATMQSGVGGLPEAIIARLGHKQDLGVHTEVMGWGMAQLIASGAVTNCRKSYFPGESIYTIAMPETVPVLLADPMARIERASIVLDSREIAKNSTLRCVNAVLQFDLLGQGNAEMIEGVQYSGVGGQLDFLRACTMADEALSILVLESTAAAGTISRIVPNLGRNATTGGRYETQVVVTEYGAAWLRDASMRQKAQRLIAIAHPAHRDRLTYDARAEGLLL